MEFWSVVNGFSFLLNVANALGKLIINGIYNGMFYSMPYCRTIRKEVVGIRRVHHKQEEECT